MPHVLCPILYALWVLSSLLDMHNVACCLGALSFSAREAPEDAQCTVLPLPFPSAVMKPAGLGLILASQRAPEHAKRKCQGPTVLGMLDLLTPIVDMRHLHFSKG